MSERNSRDEELRKAEDIHEEYGDDWEPPGLLDAPPPRPGFVQRWVRTRLGGSDDASNVGKKFNQGWRPRAASSIPKDSYYATTKRDGKDVIGMEGVILMERPEKLHQAHARRNKQMADAQLQAADQDLFRVHTPGQGFSRPEKSSHSRVVKGRPVQVADD